MRKILFPLLASTLVALFAKTANAMGRRASLEGNVWMVIRPVNCLGNPWEKDWLARHKNQGTKYPRTKEIDVIRAFFKKRGATVLEIRSKPYLKGDPLCKTCDCPRGDTLFLLVNSHDTPKLVHYGFTDRFPEEPPEKSSSHEKSSKHAAQ